jgi:hypothetical protein
MRTPINMSGKLSIDILGGGCHFIKNGKEVSPAICHFAYPYSHSWEYRFNCYLIHNPTKNFLLLWFLKTYFWLTVQAKNRIKHIKKTLALRHRLKRFKSMSYDLLAQKKEY